MPMQKRRIVVWSTFVKAIELDIPFDPNEDPRVFESAVVDAVEGIPDAEWAKQPGDWIQTMAEDPETNEQLYEAS